MAVCTSRPASSPHDSPVAADIPLIVLINLRSRIIARFASLSPDEARADGPFASPPSMAISTGTKHFAISISLQNQEMLG
jgi:hypothetical protein